MQARELAFALRNLPKDLVMYKTIAAFKDQALEYLDAISAAVQVRWLFHAVICVGDLIDQHRFVLALGIMWRIKDCCHVAQEAPAEPFLP